MKKKGKIIGIISAIVVFLVPIIQNVISHKIEDIDLLELIKKIFINVVNFIIGIINFKIPLWVIMVIIFIVVLVIKLYLKNEKVENKEFEGDKYLKEKYDGLTYTWRYGYEFGEKIIKDLKPICECGCDLLEKDSYNNYHKSGGYLVCPICDKGYTNNFQKNEQAVRNIITYKYNNMLERYNNEEDNFEEVNFKNLNKEEKYIIKQFYIPELNKYTNRKKKINSDNKTVDLLIERKILKEQNEYELIENYTSDGTFFQLTDEAIKYLNKS